MLISPIVLVRLLTVGEFGRYREFLVYSSVLASIAAFSIPNSLLYFVPADPARSWQFVRQTVQLTALTSFTVVLCVVIGDLASGGNVIGKQLWPVAIYVIVFANIDFWEYLWLATQRPIAVFAYTSGRLVSRMLVVITLAYFFHQVEIVLWGLIALESVRLCASALAWQLAAPKAGMPAPRPGDWRRMLHFCLPIGGSNLLSMSNRYAASVFVAKAMGPVALAHYTIGTYVEPIIITLRNSLSDALLPAIVNRGNRSQVEAVTLWQRGTVIAAILLFPIGCLIERYADTLIVTVFSSTYQAAVPVLRIFLIVLIRECFDFPMALKAINKTRYFLYGDVAAIVINLTLLVALVPTWGLVGVTTAYVISSWLQGLYLGWCTTQFYEIPVRKFIPWAEMSKVVLAAALPLALTYGSYMTDHFKLFGVIMGSTLYLPAYALLLRIFHVREAHILFERVRERLLTYMPTLRT
ncbi:MAG: oligosaccharide flippase family protein [Steroidobacteraceae bacterium]